MGGRWTDAGTVNYGNFNFESSSQLVSYYGLNLNYSLSGTEVFGLSSAKADNRAVNARIRSDRFNLESAVTQQYLAALRARDGVRVSEQQFERAEENHELVSNRVRVGAALSTDGKQAEVDMGRAEVALIRALNLLRTEKSRLMEQMGVLLDQDVELTSEFELFEPRWSREELVSRALDGHPRLRSFQAQQEARKADVRQAGSSYFPRLSASAQWAGFAQEFGNPNFLLAQERASAQSQMSQCQLFNQISAGLSEPLDGFPQDCGQYRLTARDERRLLESNDVFPFDFTSQPLQLTFTLSVPIFNGFTRERQLEQAQVALADARENHRAEELRLRTAVNQAYDDLMTAHDVVEIEERNRQVAQEQLDLARERYRLGAASFLELQDAEISLATAERDYLNAVYDFHNALSALETAVGTRLLEDAADESNDGEDRP
jgi:outer membrane protein